MIQLPYRDIEVGSISGGHPEAFCDECRNPNVTWYADNELWNKVMPDDGGILCPQCFAHKAEAKGLNIIFHCSEVISSNSEWLPGNKDGVQM